MNDLLMKFFGETLKLFALMAPPVAVTAFLSVSKQYDQGQKLATARKCALAVFILGITLYFSGERVFAFFGFTLDAFRIGAGALLFLSAVSLMNESPEKPFLPPGQDISIVPLAVPLCMGPASIGTVIVMGASAADTVERAVGAFSLLTASLGIYLSLRFSEVVQRRLGNVGMAVLSKLTGLLIAGIAAQVVFTGIHAFFP
jgi:multiple antibiotic resistance protein